VINSGVCGSVEPKVEFGRYFPFHLDIRRHQGENLWGANSETDHKAGFFYITQAQMIVSKSSK